ncbi:MAG: hypothetical protein ACYDD1_16195 [Caulobacteraceae bacterium]
MASLAFHALLLAALLRPLASPSITPTPAPMTVALVSPPLPPPPKIIIAKPAAKTAAAKPSAPPPAPRPQTAPRDIPALPAQPLGQGVAGVSDGDLDGAETADSGAPGGACDMVRRLQAALRKDALVQAAAASVGRSAVGAGKAVLVWNGDWVATPGEDGKGLSAVREAILWEVGFSPPACRSAAVHGLVLISLSDTPGVARLVLGGRDWRWSDLLTPRGLNRPR